jgi:hypothetical protein
MERPTVLSGKTALTGTYHRKYRFESAATCNDRLSRSRLSGIVLLRHMPKLLYRTVTRSEADLPTASARQSR